MSVVDVGILSNQIVIRGVLGEVKEDWIQVQQMAYKYVLVTQFSALTVQVIGGSHVHGMGLRKVGEHVTVIGSLRYEPDAEYPLIIDAMQMWVA